MKGHPSAARVELILPGDKLELLRVLAKQSGLSGGTLIRLAINRLLEDGKVKLPVEGNAKPDSKDAPRYLTGASSLP